MKVKDLYQFPMGKVKRTEMFKILFFGGKVSIPYGKGKDGKQKHIRKASGCINSLWER